MQRRRPELAEGTGVRRLDGTVAAPGAGPHERAEADGEARRHGVGLAAPARGPPHRGRRRSPRGIRGRAALLAAAMTVPLRREPPVADHAAGAPGRWRRGRRLGDRHLLLAAARYDPGEPRTVLSFPGSSLILVLRSVVAVMVMVIMVVAEERGEHGEPAGSPLLVPDAAFLERAASAVGGPDLRRPEEEQARVVPERAARRIRLPAGHVR